MSEHPMIRLGFREANFEIAEYCSAVGPFSDVGNVGFQAFRLALRPSHLNHVLVIPRNNATLQRLRKTLVSWLDDIQENKLATQSADRSDRRLHDCLFYVT